MQFRHEVKHEISETDLLILRQRLRAVMKPDSHAVNGRYEIRSLYFDSPDDKALR
ncbi:MAG: molecular chaperone, partial [Clostridia bacterium]|nr:molecular chaperone [Clostridia bacterium]